VRAHLPSAPTAAVDSTGAGDAFAAALAVALVEGRPVVDAARFAVAAATLKVRSYGAQAWRPSRRAIEALVVREGDLPSD
jgi:ribokinase